MSGPNFPLRADDLFVAGADQLTRYHEVTNAFEKATDVDGFDVETTDLPFLRPVILDLLDFGRERLALQSTDARPRLGWRRLSRDEKEKILLAIQTPKTDPDQNLVYARGILEQGSNQIQFDSSEGVQTRRRDLMSLKERMEATFVITYTKYIEFLFELSIILTPNENRFPASYNVGQVSVITRDYRNSFVYPFQDLFGIAVSNQSSYARGFMASIIGEFVFGEDRWWTPEHMLDHDILGHLGQIQLDRGGFPEEVELARDFRAWLMSYLSRVNLRSPSGLRYWQMMHWIYFQYWHERSREYLESIRNEEFRVVAYLGDFPDWVRSDQQQSFQMYATAELWRLMSQFLDEQQPQRLNGNRWDIQPSQQITQFMESAGMEVAP